jgi:uncharacterized protein
LIVGIAAGIIVGFILGFFGAGSAVIGLPIILLFSNLDGHMALGTNVAGVSMIAFLILIYRFIKKDILILEAVVFTIPGLIGNYSGIKLGLLLPGHKLLFLLGFILFLIACWIFYLSIRKDEATKNAAEQKDKNKKRLFYIGIIAFVVGATAGFFAISGGFMIVPALMLAGNLELNQAAGTAILPIVAFTGLAGTEYFMSGAVDTTISFTMLLPGILGGITGIWLAKKLPKKIMQKLFAIFLVLIGIYMVMR